MDVRSEAGPSRPPSHVPVLLFRTPPSASDDDLYLRDFEPPYKPHYIPVIAETYRLSELTELLYDSSAWQGVIITSRRGAEGWIRAAESIDSNGTGVGVKRTDWSAIPLYTVGLSSVDALESSNLPKHLIPSTSPSRIAKSAYSLLLLLRNEDRVRETLKPYLILRGDKSVGEIPLGLKDLKQRYREVEVYETIERPDLKTGIAGVLSELGEERNGWFIFFSPSSAGYAIQHLERLGVDLRNSKAAWTRGKVGAIGETTRKYLEGKGVKVDAVAEEPTAQGLLRAMRQSDA